MDQTKSSCRLKEWFPNLDAHAQERLRIYQFELLRWTAKINLISVNSESQADRVHFADCIRAMDIFLELEPEGEVWDIGSGNGFPGVILGILSPERKIVLIESDVRKASFLKNLLIKLSLSEVTVRNERIEDQKEGLLILGICRGFAPLDQALTFTGKSFGRGSRFYHMKGPDWVVEKSRIPQEMCSTWNISLAGSYLLPEPRENENRVLIRTTRI